MKDEQAHQEPSLASRRNVIRLTGTGLTVLVAGSVYGPFKQNAYGVGRYGSGGYGGPD